ncbi:protein SNORC [Chanos chanos]|uniref:Protein SNORC n=1 Tax=Chanos chanos TaxID=29144 RepID=A0A6J2VDP5_CHACN|nr:protein SNORC [Chanos chanos]
MSLRLSKEPTHKEQRRLPREHLVGTMAFFSDSLSQLLFLTVLALCVLLVRTETVAGAAPTLQSDNQDTLSGGGALDITTKDPFHDVTENAFTFEYDDTTYSQAMDEEEGVLGPGAITAIVIAVFLGASVLLALIVITLRKFTAS